MHDVDMATRTPGRVVRRPSLPLTEQDEHDLALIRTSPGQFRALVAQSKLADLVGEGGYVISDLTESAIIHAVFEAGLRAVRGDAEATAYAELAQQRDNDASERRATARRRTPAWADES